MTSKTKKPVLGKGLGALIPKKITTTQIDDRKESRVSSIEIDIQKINVNPDQPRVMFDEEKIQELKASIEKNGLIQPLIVEKKGDAFQLIAGERRLRALKELGFQKVECVVKSPKDVESFVWALIENIQRQDLNPIEEAKAYQKLMKIKNFTQEELAQQVGKSRPAVTNALRILTLPSEIQNLVMENKLTAGHVRALITIENKELQSALVKRCMSEGWSVRELENHLNEVVKPVSPKKGELPVKPAIDADIKSIMEEFQRKFGCKVLFKGNLKKGSVVFEYYNRDDLDRLVELFQRI